MALLMAGALRGDVPPVEDCVEQGDGSPAVAFLRSVRAGWERLYVPLHEVLSKLDGLLAVWKQRRPVYLALTKAREIEVSLGVLQPV